MANRTVLVIAAALAGAALTVAPGNAAPAEEECIARPKGTAPAGKHWYYNTNRKTNRKCWFLADKGTKVVAPALSKQSSAPKEQPVAAAPAEEEQRAESQPAADARAELVVEPADEKPAAVTAAIEPEVVPNATVGAAVVPRWSVAGRWPDASEAFSLGQYFMANDLASASRAESPSPAPAAAAPVVAPAEQPSPAVDITELSPAHFTVLFLVAVILGGLIVTFVVSRRASRRHSFGQRHAPRHAVYFDEGPMQPAPAMRPARRRSNIAAE